LEGCSNQDTHRQQEAWSSGQTAADTSKSKTNSTSHFRSVYWWRAFNQDNNRFNGERETHPGVVSPETKGAVVGKTATSAAGAATPSIKRGGFGKTFHGISFRS
jgi:hypothetical protein